MSRFVVHCSWNEVPHLTEEQKADLWDSIPAYQRDARTKGIPQLGSGAVYPILESEIIVPPFSIPEHYVHAYGMDVGWNRTAAIWGAQDPETNVIYLYSEHYRGDVEAPVHAEAIKARGRWIPGVVDPASKGRSPRDGRRLIDLYRGFGLDLQAADSAVETGIYKCHSWLSSGRVKVFENLTHWREEFRFYRREEDKEGRIKVVKYKDHLMDAMRYLIMSGVGRMKSRISAEHKERPEYSDPVASESAWMM